MNKSVKIHISPIKRLYHILETAEKRDGVAAILCSTNVADRKKLEGIKYIQLLFEDVTNPKHRNAFRKGNAQQIKRFVQKLEEMTDLYICCDSGVSRSTAVAAAVLRYMGKKELSVWRNVHYQPNPLVYRLQCRALGLPCSKLRVFLLSKYNKWLFKKQIRNQRK